MTIGAHHILDYIPQRKPFVVISKLLYSDVNTTTTTFEIEAEQLFVEHGVLTAPALIENMAQTAAAGVGYQFSLKKEAVPNGFIGAIKNLEILALPCVGQTLQTTVEVLQEIFGVTLIKGTISVDGQAIASCEMKIVLDKSN